MNSKTLIAFLAVLSLTGISLFITITWVSYSAQTERSVPIMEYHQPSLLYGMSIDNRFVIEETIKKNELLGDILYQYNVPAKLIHQIANLPRHIFDVRKVATNKKYTLICEQDSLMRAKALVYEPNALDYVVMTFGDTLSVDICKRDITIVEKGISGIIRSTLSETIEEMHITHELTNKFVDIFAWQVDFQRLQVGDAFKLLYEEIQVEGKPVGIEKINGIYFQHFGTHYYAYPFDQAEGKSMRKALLKYPIEFTRISSRYNLNRFHPVQKRWKAHLGTDFAAPTGTPIRSVGDGLIEEAQYKSNNGNYVKIRHNATYTTQYLHMSRIAQGVHKGTRVRQGQLIGYVGSTGLATGAHLCYRFWKNGVQVDALKIDLPPSQPVKEEKLIEFNIVASMLKAKLDLIVLPREKTVLAASVF
jgi:murein DD-endopeptidase MepM/ murein hydrolase activator NlpD